MYPRNGQQNTAYNHPVTGQKKTVPLHINSKNLHKTWSVKIDAVFIVSLKLLKCLHIVCSIIVYLPTVHVHKIIMCWGFKRVC